MRRVRSWRPVALVFLGLALASGLSAAATTQVGYLAGGSVYVEAGRLDGIAEGDTLEVLRSGVRIARIRVAYVASHRSTGSVLGAPVAISVGDQVRYTPRPVEPGAAAGASDTSARAAPAATPETLLAALPPAPTPRLHGRVGAGFLTVSDLQSTSQLEQPALNLRLDGANLGGSPVDVGIDVRGRRTLRTPSFGAPSLEPQANVYRMSLAVHDASGLRRATVGRQSVPAFVGVSLFDGILLESSFGSWGAGLLGGAQPNPVTLGISTDIVEGGAYVGFRPRATAPVRWRFDAGGITSYQSGQPNRDFLFFQGVVQAPRLFASATQEVDINRGWKRAMGEPAVTPTSTFISARYQPVRPLALRLGFDNRRNVLLYRDHLTPEAEFDDRFRIGGWGGASLDVGRHLRVDGDIRVRGGAPAERSDTWSGGAEARALVPLAPVVRARASQNRSATTTSDLISLSLAVSPWGAARLEFTGGSRSATDRASGVTDDARWEAIDGDIAIVRRWYLHGSFEHDHGALENMRQVYTGLDWSF